MKTFDVTVSIRIRLKASSIENAENAVLNLLEPLWFDGIEEIGIPLTADNPQATEVNA